MLDHDEKALIDAFYQDLEFGTGGLRGIMGAGTNRMNHCDGGVIITASHNPKEYNGYKVSWNDGGQVVSPHDTGIIDEVRKIKSVSEIASGGDPSKIVMLGAETDSKFMAEVKKISINSDMIKRNADMGIVYTPLHGTGYKMVPEALAMYGFI